MSQDPPLSMRLSYQLKHKHKYTPTTSSPYFCFSFSLLKRAGEKKCTHSAQPRDHLYKYAVQAANPLIIFQEGREVSNMIGEVAEPRDHLKVYRYGGFSSPRRQQSDAFQGWKNRPFGLHI